MDSIDGASFRQIVGAEFTGEVPSFRDGPNVAVPPKTMETDKMAPPPPCLEPEGPSIPKQLSPERRIRAFAARQQDDGALPAAVPPPSQDPPLPCGGHEVETKGCKPREGLTCVHCGFILRDAMQTEDGHRVCLSCVKEVKSKGGSCDDCALVIKDEASVTPDFAARREINKLQVLCRNNGCKWSGSLEDLEEHEARECDFRKIACHLCAKPVPCKAMKDHVVSTCDHRNVVCDFCLLAVKQFQLKEHHQTCNKFKVECVDCHELVPRDELENHRDNECDFVQCPVCEDKMPRDAVGEHLKNSVDHFEHLQLLTKQVKHLRVEVQTLHQWLAQAEAAMQAKSASPASSETSPDALQLIDKLTKRLDSMDEEKKSQTKDMAALKHTVNKQANEIRDLREEVRRTNRHHDNRQPVLQYNSGRSFSAVNQTGEGANNYTFFGGEVVSPMPNQVDLMASVVRMQDQIRSVEQQAACAKSAQEKQSTQLEELQRKVEDLFEHSSRSSASGKSSKLFDGVVDLPEATTGELFPLEWKKKSVLEHRVEELEQNVAAMSVQISDVDLQFQASLVTSYNGQFVWRIPDLSRRIRDAKQGKVTSIYSPPFYTSKSGYKMCIRTYLNGDGMGEKTHVSVFFVIMKGEYDALLPWPFQSRVSLQLLNQENGQHITETFRPNPSSKSFQRPTSEMNVASGCPRFAALATLTNPAYVKNDVLFIKCTVDTSGLVHP